MTTPERALKHFGIDTQLLKLAEECSELSQAALKFHEYRSVERSAALAEELADVEIMLEQMRAYFGDTPVDAQRANKITRLERRITEAETQPCPKSPPPPPQKRTPGGRHDARRVTLDGSPYPSVWAAARALGVNPSSVLQRLAKSSSCTIDGVLIKEVGK